jgi:hypothetical protein
MRLLGAVLGGGMEEKRVRWGAVSGESANAKNGRDVMERLNSRRLP